MKTDSPPNIAFKYRYRDTEHYETVVFENPDGWSLDTVDDILREKLIDEAYFDPEVWGLEQPHVPGASPEHDHPWCEFISVSHTDDPPTYHLIMFNFMLNIPHPGHHRSDDAPMA